TRPASSAVRRTRCTWWPGSPSSSGDDLSVDRQEARRVLGIAPGAAWEDVRRAYREKIRHHHPDRSGSTDTDAAVRVIEAYRVLEELRDQPEAPPPPPRGRPRATFRTSYRRGTTAAPSAAQRSDHGFTTPGPAEAPPSPW